MFLFRHPSGIMRDRRGSPVASSWRRRRPPLRVALAANKTWDAGGDGVSWNSAANWSANGVPEHNDAVTIASGTVTINANTNKLDVPDHFGWNGHDERWPTIRINGTAPNFFTVSGGTFTGGSGTITDGGDLTISGGTLTAGTGASASGGNVNVSDTVTYGGDPTLVGYWAFDDASPTLDSSGNGTRSPGPAPPLASTSDNSPALDLRPTPPA